MNLYSSLTSIPGIGPSTYLKLNRLGLESVLDLLQLYPTRHDDYSLISSIAFLQTGETVTIKATVVSSSQNLTRRNFAVQTLKIKDQSDTIEAIWFNQPYVLRQFKSGQTYLFSGKVSQFGSKLVLLVAEYEPEDTIQIHTARFVPYYTGRLGVSSKVLRQKIFYVLGQLTAKDFMLDPIPKLSQLKLLSSQQALINIHFPKNALLLKQAKERLAFEQLLDLKLNQLQKQINLQTKSGPKITIDVRQLGQFFVKNLPFQLTASQHKTISEINDDFGSKQPLDRILMGDVGSGKTVIMAYAAYLMAKAVIMAPTEALAHQHYQSFGELLKFANVKCGLLTAKNKISNLDQYSILIGTHALLYAKLNFTKIGLLIIDEQHKFGVSQRQVLTDDKHWQPFVLMVSATPIPRSLALTLYGQTQVSYLTESPNSFLVKTYLVPESKHLKSYQWIRNQIKAHQVQIYVVCAAIENKQGRINELKTVTQEKEKLQELLPELRIESIHSKHPQKNEYLNQFRKHALDILITTSLIEVGLDIGNASIMLIEDADRFGLSQLHQLRGRIGRRGQQAFCFLFSQSQTPSILSRLRVLEKNHNALEIATLDLKLRGPGDLLGTAQHGFSFVKTEDLLNTSLIETIAKTAKQILANYETKGYTSILVNKFT